MEYFIMTAVISSAIEAIVSWSGVVWACSASTSLCENLVSLAVRHDAIVSVVVSGCVEWALVALSVIGHEVVWTFTLG